MAEGVNKTTISHEASECAIWIARLSSLGPLHPNDIKERIQQAINEATDHLKVELDGERHNRFYDQRDAYFEGLKDQHDR